MTQVSDSDEEVVKYVFTRSTGILGNTATLRIQDRRFKGVNVLTVEDLYIAHGIDPWTTDWSDSPSYVTIHHSASTGVLIIEYRNSNAPRTTLASGLTIRFKAQWQKVDKVYLNDESVDIKVSNDCDMYRLVSPNYNGQFEFSLAKNGGTINKFNVDYTYKPLNPYIHINPDFNELYGEDFNDARGLILGGDFSLPIITDAFTDYEVRNKNYQAIFDREIQSLDLEQSIQRQEAAFGIAGGVATGAASGAVTGAMSGAGPYGAIAGAVVGGATSAIGGAMDYGNLLKRQQEQKSFKSDMFDLQLGNVEAMPYSLAKTTSLTYNNKIWPMIEIYTATEEEKEALRNKLEYTGMTVNAIGKLYDYTVLGTTKYVKGQLIRLPELKDDSHMAYVIYDEISKGVYL